MDRKLEILQSLAAELETQPGARVTTAKLARSVGVSEAALYRHFASKAQMFEGLIGFAEDTVFGLVNRVMEEQRRVEFRCRDSIDVLLRFADSNPGIARVLVGDALVGEQARLRTRVNQFFDRVETQLRQMLRESAMDEGVSLRLEPEAAAALLLAYASGCVEQFVRTAFDRRPQTDFAEHWPALERAVFRRDAALS